MTAVRWRIATDSNLVPGPRRMHVGSYRNLLGWSFALTAIGFAVWTVGDRDGAIDEMPLAAAKVMLDSSAGSSADGLASQAAAAVVADGVSAHDRVEAAPDQLFAPTREQLTAYRAVRGIARMTGKRLPRFVSGPPTMWAEIETIHAAYASEYDRSDTLFTQRLMKLAMESMAADRSRHAPVGPFRRTSHGRAIRRAAPSEGIGQTNRVVHVGADQTYEFHVPRGQDGTLDSLEDEMFQAAAVSTDALLTVLDLYHVAY